VGKPPGASFSPPLPLDRGGGGPVGPTGDPPTGNAEGCFTFVNDIIQSKLKIALPLSL